jgi:hypothetical protein
MSKPYTPKPGCLADRVLKHLLAGHPPVVHQDFPALFNTTINNIGPGLKAALAHGLFQKTKVDGRSAIGLGDGQSTATTELHRTIEARYNMNDTPNTTDPDPGEALVLTRWSDGDMFAQGLGVTDDGQVRFTQAQLQQIVNFACMPHVTVPGYQPF